MQIGTWNIEENTFLKDKVEQNGSRFLIGNGYMGYRGTLEEFGKDELVALNMAGLFDKNGDLWRESVNAPNPFCVKVSADGEVLSALTARIDEHRQTLDIQNGIHSRKTVFNASGAKVTVEAERFLSMKRENLAAIKFSISSDTDTNIHISTCVDTDIWNINGEHFTVLEQYSEADVNVLKLQTNENKTPICVYEYIVGAENETEVALKADEKFEFVKLCGIYWGDGCEGSLDAFKAIISEDYATLLAEHKAVWADIWANSDVRIDGDEEAQFAIRYSIYHLSSIVPRNTDKCSIPARGLSGQVYKGAAFWDTEMFMMPFFSFTDTALCKNLAKYRINTIEGAKRKAKEFGFEGAFYAWESQESGDDACTLFNITDVFTNRPMRTHFKDKQIHISADAVYGLWEYCTVSGDYSLLFEGGLEMMYQCLLFFYSFAVYKPLKSRYEILDVVGPDEYHERVDNNAFTNKMAAYVAAAFDKALDYVKNNDPAFFAAFAEKHDLSVFDGFVDKLYIPQPNENGIIEQFDGYFKLEDISLAALKERIIIPNEYLGGGNGLATTTRILKQADVLMMLNVFRSQYSDEIKKANWAYYEPYTEHGSSLSACAYGIVAAGIGMPDWAYKYFMKTATVDLTGDTKQYLGSLYIGGTHPAANGGSWNAAVFGFGGVSYTDDALDVSPKLPAHWDKLSFKLLWKGVRLTVCATHNGTTITADKPTDGICVTVNKEKYIF